MLSKPNQPQSALPVQQSRIPIEEDKYEVDATYQSQPPEIPEQSYELERDLYPFEKFAQNELGLIRGKNKNFYYYCKRLAGKREDIAYWLYELGQINNDTRKQYVKFAQKYFDENEKFNPIKLKVHYRNINVNSEMSASYLDRQYRAMCSFGKCAYGFEAKEFAKIKWIKKGQQIEKTKAAKSSDTIKWLHQQLRNENDKENALIIHLMYALALRANEISFLRFEDIIKQDREYVA